MKKNESRKTVERKIKSLCCIIKECEVHKVQTLVEKYRSLFGPAVLYN